MITNIILGGVWGVNTSKIKVVTSCLVLFFVISLMGGAVLSKEDLKLEINGEEVIAEMFVQDGRTRIESDSVNDILGTDYEEEFIPLRDVFEAAQGIVNWNGQTRTINISLQEPAKDETKLVDGLTAEEIVIKAEEYMLEKNTYKMAGEGVTLTSIQMPEMPEMPPIELPATIDAKVQYDPLTIYIVQSFNIPEELQDEMMAEELDMGLLTNVEMLITDKEMYQKYGDDIWVVTSFEEFDMEEMFQYFINLDPRTSMELAKEFGIEYELVDCPDCDDYYVVSVELDSDGFKDLMKEFMGEDFIDLVSGFEDEEITEEELTQMKEEIAMVMDSLEISMTQDMYVNKATFATSEIHTDMDYNLHVVEKFEGESIELSVSTSTIMHLDIFDYGVELDFPTVEEAITQEELMDKLMEDFEYQKED